MDLVAELSNIVGPEHVLTSADTTAAHTTDWTSRFHGEAFAVVRRLTRSRSLPWLRHAAAGRPIHPSGWQHRSCRREHSGLTSDPTRTPVVVSSRLSWIGDVDVHAGQVTVGAGATLADVQHAALRAGWYYGVDIAARDSATIAATSRRMQVAFASAHSE